MVNKNYLKAAMIRKGLTQADVAKQMGLSTQTYNRMVNGRSQFTVGDVRKLISILDLTSNDVKSIFFANLLDDLSNQ